MHGLRHDLEHALAMRDGRRQIDEFHFAGDYFGLEMTETHRINAEAMSDATIRMIRRGALSDLAAQRSDIRVATARVVPQLLRRQATLRLESRDMLHKVRRRCWVEAKGRFERVELHISWQGRSVLLVVSTLAVLCFGITFIT